MTIDASAAAIVLAAGLSRRMGRFKLTLPWNGETVVGHVVSTLGRAGVAEIVVVVGHRAAEVEATLAGQPVRCVPNPHYADGQMLGSIRAGLAALGPEIAAALLCLGDQPQMEEESVRAVLAKGAQTHWESVIVPSYGMRAGHPILLPRNLWDEVQQTAGTLRDVLRANANRVQYLVLDAASILADLDTPADYEQAMSRHVEG